MLAWMLIEYSSMDIVQALEYGNSKLAGLDSPEIDSQALLCHSLSCQTTYLHTWPDKILSNSQQANYESMIQQRSTGIPVAHLTGQRGFWTLDLNVTTDTLIPRVDTELLVSLALEKLKPNMLVADLGTGSGAIALALAQEQPQAKIIAIDFSRSALCVAKQNADKHQIENAVFWCGSWLAAVADNSLDMVVSNPPYIEADDPHLVQGDVRFEPLTALISGLDGLDDIRIIIKQAGRCLKPSGWLLIEHGYNQAQQVQQLFQQSGFIEISSHQDFGDNDRVVRGRLG